jgi:hypothetical protein
VLVRFEVDWGEIEGIKSLSIQIYIGENLISSDPINPLLKEQAFSGVAGRRQATKRGSMHAPLQPGARTGAAPGPELDARG